MKREPLTERRAVNASMYKFSEVSCCGPGSWPTPGHEATLARTTLRDLRRSSVVHSLLAPRQSISFTEKPNTCVESVTSVEILVSSPYVCHIYLCPGLFSIVVSCAIDTGTIVLLAIPCLPHVRVEKLLSEVGNSRFNLSTDS